MALYSDTSIARVESAVASRFNELEPIAHDITRAVMARVDLPSSEVLVGEPASTYMRRVVEAAEYSGRSIYSQIAAGEWLWLLRRARSFFDFNEIPTTRQYGQQLAENLSARSAQSVTTGNIRNGTLFVEPSTRRIRLLLRIIGWAGVMYDLHSMKRWAGKGSPIRTAATDLPRRTDTPGPLEEAVRQYDDRVAASSGNILDAAGLFDYSPNTEVRESALQGIRAVPLITELRERIVLPLPIEQIGGITHVHGQFYLVPVTLETINALAVGGVELERLLHRRLVHTIAFLMSHWHPSVLAGSLATICTVGYSAVTRTSLAQRLNWALAGLGELFDGKIDPAHLDISGERLIDELDTTDIAIWPWESHRLVRRIGADLYLADLEGGSLQFQSDFTRSWAGGSEANVYAGLFESQIRQLIADSPWGDPDLERKYAGRTLRVNGDALTDIDAIGRNGSYLLIISCKSRARTPEFERGDYGAVRNVRLAAEEAHAELQRVVRTLKASPSGPNYDFSWAQEISGTVVMPFVPFVHLGPETQDSIPGVKAICSATELWMFLNK